jgi:protein-S-isoprenylcysteine O-methyltransferase Ste14
LYYCLLLAVVAVSEPLYWRAALGRVVELAGFALIAIATLGRVWTTLYIAGRKDASTVVQGPYARCRHPLYALSVLASLGLGLATRSVVLALVTISVSLALHITAAIREERSLQATLGSAYREYAARVPRFWPRRADVHLPASLVVSPAILWKAFLDAGSMMALYIAFEMVAAGRDAGLWPTLLSVY